MFILEAARAGSEGRSFAVAAQSMQEQAQRLPATVNVFRPGLRDESVPGRKQKATLKSGFLIKTY